MSTEPETKTQNAMIQEPPNVESLYDTLLKIEGVYSVGNNDATPEEPTFAIAYLTDEADTPAVLEAAHNYHYSIRAVGVGETNEHRYIAFGSIPDLSLQSDTEIQDLLRTFDRSLNNTNEYRGVRSVFGTSLLLTYAGPRFFYQSLAPVFRANPKLKARDIEWGENHIRFSRKPLR